MAGAVIPADHQQPAARTGGGAAQPPPGPTRIVGEPVVVHEPMDPVIKSDADLRAAEARRSAQARSW